MVLVIRKTVEMSAPWGVVKIVRCIMGKPVETYNSFLNVASWHLIILIHFFKLFLHHLVQ